MKTGKKIVVVINDQKESLNALYFVKKLFVHQSNSNLIDIVYIHSSEFKTERTSELKAIRPSDIESEEVRIELNQFLEEIELTQNTKANLHKQVGNNTQMLSWRCNYADLLVTTSEGYAYLQNTRSEKEPSLSACTECAPFVVVPNNFENVENVLIVYGSNVENINGIKQFCYLFQNICSQYDVNLLQVFQDGRNPFEIKEERMFVEYLKQHCTRLGIHKYIGGEPIEILKNHLSFSSKTLVVSNDKLFGELSELLEVNTFHSQDNTVSSTQFIAHY